MNIFFTWSYVDTSQIQSNRPCFEEFIKTTDIKGMNRANIVQLITTNLERDNCVLDEIALLLQSSREKI